MGDRNAQLASMIAASPVCGVVFDAARPTLEAYCLHFITQVWLAWLVPEHMERECGMTDHRRR